MNRVLRSAIGLALLACSSGLAPLSARSRAKVLDDGTYVITDCWCKGCTTWSTKDAHPAQKWIGAAYLDGEKC